MKIDFIGNGNIVSNNFNASYIIDDYILFDAPAGILKVLKESNHNVSEIDVIVITHMHGDHFFDLPFILFHEFVKKREKPIILIGPKQLKRKLRLLTKLAFPNSYNKILNTLDITYIDATSIYNTLVGDLKITSVKMIHGPLKNCYGYIFSKIDKKVGFTGDTEMCPGLTYMIKEVNVIISDVSKNSLHHHLDIKDFINLCENNKITFIPTHYPDYIKEKLKDISNVKIINCHEQFYI